MTIMLNVSVGHNGKFGLEIPKLNHNRPLLDMVDVDAVENISSFNLRFCFFPLHYTAKILYSMVWHTTIKSE